jgi:POTRA domain-containing FtsQ-type protein
VRQRLPPIARPGGWTVLAAICALGIVALAVAGTPRIAVVDVTGTRHLAREDAVAATGLLGQPAFRSSGADARRALLALPAVRDARVTLALPDRAIVSVAEREAVGRWVAGPTEWFVDADGVLFRSRDPNAAPPLRAFDDRELTRSCAGQTGGRCVDPALVQAALRLAAIAPRELRPDLVRPEAHIDAANGLVLRSGSGWDIRFGGPDWFNEKLALARKFLSDEPTRRLDYVDVRSPDRIVFSPQ